MSNEITVLRPDNALRKGYASLVSDILRELVATRWLTYQLFKRDLFAFYKQSIIGVFWIILLPLITVGTFIILRGSGVVATGEINIPYPIYAVLGVAFWQLFAQGLVSGANSLVQGGEMITRINFSKKALVIASTGRTIVSFGVLVLLVIILFVVYSFMGFAYTPPLGILLVPFAIIPLYLLTLGLSFYMALLNAIMRDVGTVLSMIIPFLMLLTPVVYERPVIGPDSSSMTRVLATITEYNPVYYLVVGPRELVLNGSITDLNAFLITSALSVVLFVFTLIGFHVTETRIAERI
jgi:lipopolysaccharide transport system permease protein